MPKKIKLYKPHPKQAAMQRRILEGSEMYHILCCGRRFGKTMMLMNLLLYWGLTEKKIKLAWMTPYQSQARAVFDELTSRGKEVIQSSNGMLGIVRLMNGSQIDFVSLENYKAIRGSGYTYVVMDEAAFVREEAIATVRPSFYPKGKKIVMISTPWTKSGFFYDYFQAGLDPEDKNYHSYKAKTMDNPMVPLDFLDDERKRLSEDDIRVEYLAEFRQDGGDVFQNIASQALISEYRASYDKRCYAGVDIALGGKDLTTVVILSETGETIFADRWRESETSKQIEKLRGIFSRFDLKRVNIEINQERGIAQQLKKDFGAHIIKEWQTTTKTKPEMIQFLKKDIEDGAIKLPTRKLDPTMITELEIFTYEAKANGYIAYAAPDGQHDDSVIALALANAARIPKRYGKQFISI